MAKDKKTGLELMREPFPPSEIGRLPKPTMKQTSEVKANFKNGIRCKICGGWHHPDVVHLDYVGHAALTKRLLDCDPMWNWEPVAVDQSGCPALDANGGMWIKLTVCGQTRLGYGDAEGARGGAAVKVTIGDALRNAAMRFGAALDLWSKEDLHADNDSHGDEKPKADVEPQRKPAQERRDTPPSPSPDDISFACNILNAAPDRAALIAAFRALPENVKDDHAVLAVSKKRAEALKTAQEPDETPYD